MPTREAIKGYLLEEILAYLIQNTGYKLLVDPSQDSRELSRRGNGLVVRGRGGPHQVDVLGQLIWIPAFTFPIRLFVEAKCRRPKMGIPEVRNAVGVIDDINQNYTPVRDGTIAIQRFTYRYALFSTSGFSDIAVHYAMAHLISLVDLSGPDFNDLRNLLDLLANLLIYQVTNPMNTAFFVANLRTHIRSVLGTWPLDVPVPSMNMYTIQNLLPNVDNFDTGLLRGVQQLGEFLVGMANGPFLLVFKPESLQDFLNYVGDFPSHDVTITWRRSDNYGRQWVVRPAYDPESYSLSFGLPRLLGDWIFGDEAQAVSRAWDVKRDYFSSITIYRHVAGRDYLYRLIYNAEATRGNVDPND